MVPSPWAVSLFLCEQVIVDATTKNPSLIGIFMGRAVEGFPSPPEQFSVFAVLTDATGSGRIEVQVVETASEEIVFDWNDTVIFADRFTVLNVHIRLRNVSFPTAGLYAVQLFVDGEHIAESRLRVYEL